MTDSKQQRIEQLEAELEAVEAQRNRWKARAQGVEFDPVEFAAAALARGVIERAVVEVIEGWLTPADAVHGFALHMSTSRKVGVLGVSIPPSFASVAAMEFCEANKLGEPREDAARTVRFPE